MALLVLLAGVAAAPGFVAQDLEGVRAGAPDPLTGQPSTNFRQADFDGDGLTDLLFRDRLAFQRAEGGFSEDAVAPLPGAAAGALIDLWQGRIYFAAADSLTVATWNPHEAAWDTEALLLDLPADSPAFEAPAGFARYLHDLNGDGEPEVVWPLEEGMALLGRRDGPGGPRYVQRAVLAVYPARQLRAADRPVLWPMAGRRLEPPVLQSACTVLVEGARILVVTRDQPGAATVRYTAQPYTVSWDGQEAGAAAGQAWTTPALPDYVQPCRLNGDDWLDFAGTHWDISRETAVPALLTTSVALLRPEADAQWFRARGFRPQVSFVDVDGDGAADLVTETSALTEGGVRETVAKLLTHSAVGHRVEVRLQDAEASRFHEAPGLTGEFRIALMAPAARSGLLFQRYRAGELVNVTGDFDGDGVRDVAVQDMPGRIAVYPARGERFSQEPWAVLETAPEKRFSVADVDGDGRSDLVVRWLDPRGGDASERSRVYLTREAPGGNLGVVVGAEP